MFGFRKFAFGCAAAALAVAATVSAPALARDLVYGAYNPPQHPSIKFGVEPTLKRIEEATDGSIVYKLFTGGAMGGAKEALKTVRDGVVDSAVIVDIYTRADLPVTTTLSSMLILADNPKVFVAAMNEVMLLKCPSCAAERERNRMVGLGWTGTATYHLLCTSDVSTLDGLQGKKVRAASRMGVMFQNMGAVPVSITAGELYEAMQRGQVDCAAGSAAWLDGYSLKDFVTHIVSTPMGAYFGAILMNVNIDTWESLSPGEQTAFKAAMPKMIGDVQFNYDNENEKTLAGEGHNAAVVEADAALNAAIAKARAEEFAAVEAEAKEKGVDGASEAIAAFKESIEKWRGIVAETGDDQEAYEKALWDEIFSKI